MSLGGDVPLDFCHLRVILGSSYPYKTTTENGDMHPTRSATSLIHNTPRNYTPGPLRRAEDSARNVVDAFLGKHPEYARLSPDVLLQYAATYRDDKDHALEQDFRDNCVVTGCRIDYKRPSAIERGDMVTSDDAFLAGSCEAVGHG
jgi:hypothetical protein